MDHILIRKSVLDDIPAIESLYSRVAAIEGGLARTAPEISREYIYQFVSKSIANGVEFVAVNHLQRIVGEIHCYNNGIKTFSHIFTDLTIAVDPEEQGKGIGKELFHTLLNEVKMKRPDILRIELIARQSNVRALHFYETLGFRHEGNLRKRIHSVGGGYEDDIVMGWLRNDAA